MKKAMIPLAAALALIQPIAPALANTLSFQEARPIKGEKALAVELNLGAGEVSIAPGSFDKLYDVRVDYSPDHLEPKVRYGEGVLSMYTLSQRKIGVPGKNHWAIAFTQKLPLTLHADLGAAKSDLDLTGLRLTDATLLMGASLATVRFSTPNPAVLKRLRIEAGAANVQGFGLGNANFETFEFKGGVGNSELDFAGDYRRKGLVKASVSVGRLIVRIPKSLGLRVKAADGWASRVKLPAELVPEDGRWVSPNFATAPGRIDLEAETRVGGIEVKWE
jgi:hypothetical protein